MIRIPIVSSFNSKGFKQAETATSMLNKGFKGLASTMAVTFSARRIAQFAEASVKAFIEEDKAVKALSRNLRNLNISYDVRPVEDYISKLQTATGVADGKLRPALQQLLITTKNLTTSQDLLNLALDISAGTGQDLNAVTKALARAYAGNNTSLGRLNLGITKADLASKSFSEITQELTDQFNGQAKAAAGTYAGQMQILANAADDAQEILGEKMVAALEILLDTDQGVPALAKSFEDMAVYIGDVTVGIAKVLELYKKVPVIGKPSGKGFIKGLIKGLFPQFSGPLDFFNFLGEEENRKKQRKEDAIARADAKEAGQARVRALGTEKKITLEKKKQNKENKEAEKLAKAGKMFDDELISLEAALANAKLSENEVLRLKLKKALLSENADQAEKLANKLAQSQQELTKLAAFKPTNPFQTWLDAIDELTNKITRLGSVTAPTAAQGNAAQSVIELGVKTGNQEVLNAGVGMLSNWIMQGMDAATLAGLESERAEAEAAVSNAKVQQAVTNINIAVNGTGGLSDDTKKEVVDAVVEASRSGFSTGWYSTTARATL